MKHLFVPYDIALLLKELGFMEKCLGYYEPYMKDQEPIFYFQGDMGYSKTDNGYFKKARALGAATAPIYKQVTDWFMEEHGIYVYFTSSTSSTFTPCLRLISEKGAEQGYHQSIYYQLFTDRMSFSNLDSAILTTIKVLFLIVAKIPFDRDLYNKTIQHDKA